MFWFRRRPRSPQRLKPEWREEWREIFQAPARTWFFWFFKSEQVQYIFFHIFSDKNNNDIKRIQANPKPGNPGFCGAWRQIGLDVWGCLEIWSFAILLPGALPLPRIRNQKASWQDPCLESRKDGPQDDELDVYLLKHSSHLSHCSFDLFQIFQFRCLDTPIAWIRLQNRFSCSSYRVERGHCAYEGFSSSGVVCSLFFIWKKLTTGRVFFFFK